MKLSKYTIASISLLLGAFFLFFFRIGYHSFWGDELQSAEMVAHLTQTEIWNPSNPNRTEQHSEHGFLAPYYSAAKIWCSVFGSSEAGLRSLSAACSVLALAMILAMGPSLWGLGHRASLVAGMLFALSPMMLWYAQEARYYAFLQPLALLSCWLYLKFWRSGRSGWLAGWCAIAILSIMSHPFMIFVIVAQSCYGLWLWRKDHFRHGSCVVIGHGIVAAGFLIMLKPLIISNQKVVANESYSKVTDELMPWKALSNFLCGVYEHPHAFLALLLVVTATAALVLHVREVLGRISHQSFAASGDAAYNPPDVGRVPAHGETGPAVVGAKKNGDAMLWIVASLGACVLMIMVSIYRPIMVEGKKYVMVFFAPFCVCLGSALTRLRHEGAKARPSLPRLLPALFLCVMTLNSVMTDWKYFTEPQKQNWRLAGQIIRQHSRAGDVWLHQGMWRAFASEYYGGGTSRVAKDVVWNPPELKDPLPSALQNAKRVWLVKTGGIADAYGARLEEAGFRRTGEQALPSGTHFMTHLWLYEKAMP